VTRAGCALLGPGPLVARKAPPLLCHAGHGHVCCTGSGLQGCRWPDGQRILAAVCKQHRSVDRGVCAPSAFVWAACRSALLSCITHVGPAHPAICRAQTVQSRTAPTTPAACGCGARPSRQAQTSLSQLFLLDCSVGANEYAHARERVLLTCMYAVSWPLVGHLLYVLAPQPQALLLPPPRDLHRWNYARVTTTQSWQQTCFSFQKPFTASPADVARIRISVITKPAVRHAEKCWHDCLVLPYCWRLAEPAIPHSEQVKPRWCLACKRPLNTRLATGVGLSFLSFFLSFHSEQVKPISNHVLCVAVRHVLR
jgi:hypothetical protein